MDTTVQPSRPAQRNVAQYLRMSTDHQKYSIANQTQLIGRHARAHCYAIVRTYADEGKSGLSFEGRPALQRMIRDVEEGADFSKVLVLDVSRWGRYLDADESAYYEFLCRQHGVDIEYCAEQFGGPSVMVNSVMKAIKRVMAGEYSRDLSRKVFDGQCRLARLGFRTGGTPPYGTRRLLLNEHGIAERILVEGQRKVLTSDRVILVPGPSAEIELVRFAFLAFSRHRLSPTLIARILNHRLGSDRAERAWSGPRVQAMLRHPAYVGACIYNRTTMALGRPVTANPPDRWIRADNVSARMVPQSLFDQAQQLLLGTSGATPTAELTKLRHFLFGADRRTISFVSAFLGIRPCMLPGRLVAAPGATALNDNRYGIVRCRDGRHGWNGRWRLPGRTKERFFGDQAYGSCLLAERAAAAWLKSERQKIAEHRRLAIQLCTRRNNQSGINGVVLRPPTRHKAACWIAFWTGTGGRRLVKSFSVAKFGDSGARARAIRARHAAMRPAVTKLARLHDDLSLRPMSTLNAGH